MDEFIPGAPQVSRRVITRRVLPNVVRDLDAQVAQSINGKEAVMQADGWTGLNHSHLIAIMISCDQAVCPFYRLTWTYIISQLYTLEVHDASRERKTAENLLRLFHAAYNRLRDSGCTVVAIVSDAAGESRKARRLFGSQNKAVVVLDCYAHQVGIVHFFIVMANVICDRLI